MKRLIITGVLVLSAGAAAGLLVTRAAPLDTERFDAVDGDANRGETVFIASGCASCHSAPEAEGGDKRVLAGGQRFETDFGTFIAPNVSPDPEAGIGDWTVTEFASAVKRGVSPEGQHYYPAFPYTSYVHMSDQDVVDMWAFWQTLPSDATPSATHELAFPFNIRRSIGVWKQLYMPDSFVLSQPETPEVERGRYLVEALAHCGECHTPRTALGGMERSSWLEGAPNPSGRGTIPSLAPDDLDWSATDIAYYLDSGFTPDYDSAGGHMVAVIENFAQLPESDRQAVAAYLKVLP
jgi:mono/diheme cytochrome c family protein